MDGAGDVLAAGPGGHHGLVRRRQGCADGVERGESGRAGVRLGGLGLDGHDRHVNRHLWAQTINLSAQETEEDRAGGGTAGAAALALNIK